MGFPSPQKYLFYESALIKHTDHDHFTKKSRVSIATRSNKNWTGEPISTRSKSWHLH